MAIKTEERLVWWGTCDKCLTTMTISAHPDRDPLPDPNDVSEFWNTTLADCPVCGDAYIALDSSDPIEGFRL